MDNVYVCCCSVIKLCLTLCDPMDCSTSGSSLSFTVPQSLLKFMYIESVMLFNHLSSGTPFSCKYIIIYM